MVSEERSEDQHAAPDAWRPRNIGRALHAANRRFENEVLARMAADGYPQLRHVHLTVFRAVDVAGTRLTELALRANLTKQGMQELVDQGEMLGFLRRYPDPADRRAKIIRFTEGGMVMLEVLGRAVCATERAMVDIVGTDLVQRMTHELLRYALEPQREEGPISTSAQPNSETHCPNKIDPDRK